MTFILMLKNLKRFVIKTPLAFLVIVILEMLGIVSVVLSYGIVRNVFSEQEQETALSRKYIVYKSENRQEAWEDSAAFIEGFNKLIDEFGADLSDAFGSAFLYDNESKYRIAFNYYANEESFNEISANVGAEYAEYVSGKKLVHISTGRIPLSVGDKLTIANSEYTVYKASPPDNMWCDIGFFYTSVPENIKVTEIHLDFEYIPLHDRILTLNDRVHELFGNNVIIVEPEIPDLLLEQFGTTSLVICAVIMLIVVINCLTVYMYIFEKRRKWLAVVKLCGCKPQKCSLIFLTEAMLVIIICTAAGAFFSKLFIVPRLSKLFKAFYLVYTTQSYIIISAAYCLLSLIILSVMIKGFVRQTIDTMRKEAI